MTAILLGCATSTGVPLIGCTCQVCTSSDPRNRRLRPSLWFEIDGTRVLVDTSPDLREQALANRLSGVDMVLFTHAHADHVHGLDDLRQFNFLQRKAIPCFAATDTMKLLQRRFDYIFDPNTVYPSAVPKLHLHPIDGPIECGKGRIIPIPVMHGSLPILGFRVGTLAYLTDISSLPADSYPLLEDIETLIIGALRHEPHPTHMTVEQAVDLSGTLRAQHTILTHMAHGLDYQTLRGQLPDGIEPGYDGLTVSFSW